MQEEDKNGIQLNMLSDEEMDTTTTDNAGEDNGGQKGILYKSIDEVLHDSMIPYTECVVMDRALPRVEDGLKPVQRRILYAMMELNMYPDREYRKSARLVGDCLGKYHPHGDTSVYDAMCRMAQDFVMRMPLVDGQGNFGSVDGDPPAAMRYTEAKLAPLALELLRDLDKDTVRWSFNFDDTLQEPDMLPGRYPNLLVNGASGIAVGVATNIPPHNLGETIDGVIAYIDNPRISLKEMMTIIKGPDFPTGGYIFFEDGLEQAYKTGKGKIMMRAKVNLETVNGRSNIVISELPYQVNKAQLLQKIAELKDQNKDKLSDIADIVDESDKSIRAVIKLKKDAKPKKILEFLYKATNLQQSFAINMVAIAGGKPKLMGLLDIIAYYAQYQRELIVRRTRFDLNAARERAHIVEGLLIAIKNIDEVIKIIKTSPNITEAKQRLKARFSLSDKQTHAILEMKLSRLVNLEVTKLEAELADLRRRIAEYEAILASKKAQFDVVKKELLEIKKNYNSPRRTNILKNGEIKLEATQDANSDEGKAFILAISAGKTIKKVTAKNYSMSVKTLSDGSTITDVHTQIIGASPKDVVLIFTNKGNCIKAVCEKIKECKWRDKGINLASIDSGVAKDEYPICIMIAGTEGHLLFYSKQGMIKKSTFKDSITTKSFYQVMKLNDGDEMIGVDLEKQGKSVLMLTKLGNCLNFEKGEVPTQGRVSGGVKGINLEGDDTVVFARQLDFTDVVVVTDNGYVKKLNASSLPVSQRYRKGLRYINFTDAKEVVFACVADNNAVIAVDFGLKILPMETKKLPELERLTTGNQIIKKKFFSIQPLMNL